MAAADAYSEKFLRNPLSRRQQERLRKARFAVVGLGGTGGFMLENLLRMGVEDIRVFDHDRFELSNFNRQPLATEQFIDMPKASAATARAREINPDAKVDERGAFGGASDLGGADIVLDGTDSLQSKLEVAKAARALKIPYVFSSAQGSRGIVTVFTSYKFERAFQLPKGGIPPSTVPCGSILCPAASLAGTLAASQAASVILRKPYAKAPEAIFFDLFREGVFWGAKLG